MVLNYRYRIHSSVSHMSNGYMYCRDHPPSMHNRTRQLKLWKHTERGGIAHEARCKQQRAGVHTAADGLEASVKALAACCRCMPSSASIPSPTPLLTPKNIYIARRVQRTRWWGGYVCERTWRDRYRAQW